MKKIAAIFFLVLITLSSGCYWILNHINYLQMKARVKEILQSPVFENDLEQFTFSAEEFQQLSFEDDGHEVELNGRMYDIVKIKSAESKKIIYCISDDKESRLKDWARKNNPQKNNNIKNLLSQTYTVTLSSDGSDNNRKDPTNIFLSAVPAAILNISYDVLKPPPRLS